MENVTCKITSSELTEIVNKLKSKELKMSKELMPDRVTDPKCNPKTQSPIMGSSPGAKSPKGGEVLGQTPYRDESSHSPRFKIKKGFQRK